MNSRIVILVALMTWIIPLVAVASERTEYLAKARQAYESKQYDDCARFYEQAIKNGAEKGAAYYEIASCYALAGSKNKAFEYLGKAIDNGYSDVDKLRRDPDLNGIRDDKRWQGIVSKCDSAHQGYIGSINRWLYMMFQADQNERSNYKDGDDWSEIAKRDSLRRERVKTMITNMQLKASDDYYHAAMIMHHGTDSLDYKMANDLAMKAVELDSSNYDALWLIAASTDRYLLKVGKPQVYGTQYNYVNGRWTLEPIDTQTITEEIREFYRVPPLKDQSKRVQELNKK